MYPPVDRTYLNLMWALEGVLVELAHLPFAADTGKGLTEAEAIPYILQIVQGLAYLHKKG